MEHSIQKKKKMVLQNFPTRKKNAMILIAGYDVQKVTNNQRTRFKKQKKYLLIAFPFDCEI